MPTAPVPARRKTTNSRTARIATVSSGRGDVPIDETTAYARAVIAGEIVACRYVRLACKRHLSDLKVGRRRGLWFDAAAAQHRIAFYPAFLRHSKGEWARQPVDLSPWQKFVIGSVFGWKRKDGTRRFRYVYEELPRKNGKSTKLAGVGLDMLACDGEAGAEIYAAATKRDQARIIFDEAKRMVGSSPDLAATITRYKLNLSIDATASKFEPLSSDWTGSIPIACWSTSYIATRPARCSTCSTPRWALAASRCSGSSPRRATTTRRASTRPRMTTRSRCWRALSRMTTCSRSSRPSTRATAGTIRWRGRRPPSRCGSQASPAASTPT
jgi:hypothetical protein